MSHKVVRRFNYELKGIFLKGKRGCSIFKKKISNLKERLDIRMHRYHTAEVSVADLFMKSCEKGELLRYDIIVRYLVIEEYHNKNSNGYELYRKMQDARMGFGYSDTALNQFKKLICSYENNGYDEKSAILLDKDMNLIDGSHRIALALYYGIQNITVNIIRSAHPVEYSMDWFIANGFTTGEVKQMCKKSEDILSSINQAFSCVIWSPAVKYSEQILADLNYYGTVSSWRKYKYRNEEYNNIVRAIYTIDDVEKWKVEKKIEHMKEFPPELVAVDIIFNDPRYRIKEATGFLLSKQGERAKKALRSKYKKMIPNYFFDIALHIADNLQQSEYMRHIFEPCIDFREALKILDKYKYALIKVDVPYMPEDFPDRIPSGKDIDILCLKDEFPSVKEELRDYAHRYTQYEIVERITLDRILLRMELSGKLVFLIDCACECEGIPEEFLRYALDARIENDRGYYMLPPEFEAIFRKSVFEKNKGKFYHMEYYKEHMDEKIQLLFEKLGGRLQ